MPATTPTLKIPYPLPADKIADYPNTAAQAADIIDKTTPTTKTYKFESQADWDADGSSGVVYQYGNFVQIPIAQRRKDGKELKFPYGGKSTLLTVPALVPVPAKDRIVGLLQLGGTSSPLIYRAAGRNIEIFAASAFTLPGGVGVYGVAQWIA